jgi:hypothetical protein
VEERTNADRRAVLAADLGERLARTAEVARAALPREGQVDLPGGGSLHGASVAPLRTLRLSFFTGRRRFSGGGPYGLACGAFLPDRVSQVAAVSSWGSIDEVEAAYATLTPDERELVSAIRADPERATQLLWDAGRWYAETPLRFLESAPEADERALRDPVIRANLADSNLEGARQEQAGLIGALPTRCRGASGSPTSASRSTSGSVSATLVERRSTLQRSRGVSHLAPCTQMRMPEHWLLISRWPDILEQVSAEHGAR